MKSCSRPQVIRETNTTVRSYYIPIRIAKIQTTGNTECWQGWRETAALLVGMQNGAATLEDSLAISYKTKDTCLI